MDTFFKENIKMAPSSFHTALCNQLKTRESRIIDALVEKFGLESDEVKEVFASVEVGLTKTGKVKKVKDPNKPKAPLNGYLYYSTQMREEVKKLLEKKKSERTFKDGTGEKVTIELKSDGTVKKPTDISKKLGAMWRALSDDERAEWLEKTEEHNKAMGHTKKAPAKKAATKKKAPAKSKNGAKSKATVDSGDSDTDEDEPEAPPPKDDSDSDSSDSDSEPEESPKPVKKAPVKKTAKKTAKGKGKGKK